MVPDRMISRLRDVKHSWWLARRRGWSAVEPFVAPAIDTGLRAYTRWVPPASSAPVSTDLARAAPTRIFCLWTGTNPMSANRQRALRELRRLNEPEVEVVLVTPETIDEWVLPDAPLHPAYEDLSLIHRSDYLRTYLMHHHGGGYSDVKAALHGWAPAFASLNADPDAWIIGYPEISYRVVAPVPRPLRRQLQVHHARLLGNCAYVVRPGSEFTARWLAEAERRLDGWREELARVPGDVASGPPGYPVPFYALLGEIFHPLCLTYHQHLRHDRRLVPQRTNYK